VELRLFFDRALGASFRDLALGEDPASPYLADLLTRFARTENLFPPGVETPRLETVVDMLLETQRVWREDTARFQPEREVVVRRHIGDFTLFMTGLFRERVERTAVPEGADSSRIAGTVYEAGDESVVADAAGPVARATALPRARPRHRADG